MILCYIPNHIEDDKLQLIKSLLNDRYMMFFCEIDNGIEIISESNQKILRDTILHNKPLLFWVDSIKGLNMSQTIVSELIIFLLRHNCIFQSESDNIYLESKDIDKVYPLVYDTFKNKIQNVV